jgi:hypothetical protein
LPQLGNSFSLGGQRSSAEPTKSRRGVKKVIDASTFCNAVEMALQKSSKRLANSS